MGRTVGVVLEDWWKVEGFQIFGMGILKIG